MQTMYVKGKQYQVLAGSNKTWYVHIGPDRIGSVTEVRNGVFISDPKATWTFTNSVEALEYVANCHQNRKAHDRQVEAIRPRRKRYV
jgi:hypothetical protein